MLTYELYKLHILLLCDEEAHLRDTYESITVYIMLLLFLSLPMQICYFKGILLKTELVNFLLIFIGYKCRLPYDFIGYSLDIIYMPLSWTNCDLQFFTHSSTNLLIHSISELFIIIITILLEPYHFNFGYIVVVVMNSASVRMFFWWYKFTFMYIFIMDNTVSHSSFHTGEKPYHYNFCSIYIMLFMQFSCTKCDFMGSPIGYDYNLKWRIET